MPASPTLALPDPLLTLSGKRVTSAAQWRDQRRPELLDLFRVNVYGGAPVRRPSNLRFAAQGVTPGMMDGKAVRKQVTISFDGANGRQHAFHLLLFVPAQRTRPAPVFLLACNRGMDNIDPTREKKSPFWPAEEIVARGYAAAAYAVEELDPDRKDGYADGVRAKFDGGKPAPDAWATIGAWAWGASRCLDYLETDKDVDARRVAVIGHSRGGKTALWAGAEDERFALVISNDSGCTGAALSRTKKGERVANINRTFPYWFCENYKKYNDREEALPIDQHELLALIAPRPLYVASATEDAWADPESEFRSAVLAGPVYELLGKHGLPTDRMPAPDSPLQQGQIAYHVRTGKHDLTLYDWRQYLDFADRHLK